ncbi:hypothetical protein D9758_010740 [Tetrapyrgos nigripes]|uniref:Uncharacterized protein n=1 Tax=Tetrapyrgos nigripes TaxID=182062 RepID=A0A8H5FZ82_9AGAR|nr:hypothetical protein D9758_010740 [Tetrapyrgos nigripes]
MHIVPVQVPVYKPNNVDCPSINSSSFPVPDTSIVKPIPGLGKTDPGLSFTLEHPPLDVQLDSFWTTNTRGANVVLLIGVSERFQPSSMGRRSSLKNIWTKLLQRIYNTQGQGFCQY